jgi:predicted PurR-regulated permease PerM
MPSKRTIFVIFAVVGTICMLLLAGLIALIIWLIGVINGPSINDTVNTVQQISTDVLQGFNLNEYIQNGSVNIDTFQQQLNTIPQEQLPQWSEQVRSQTRQLVDSGQLIQSEADKILNLLP